MQLNNFCGIDVGCTNIKMMAILDGVRTYKTIPSGDNLTRNELVNAICDFYLSFNNNFSGLGITFSGCTKDFIKVNSTTLQCLEGLSASDFSKLNCGLVRLVNDSNAATLAGTLEYPDSKVLVGITNGTGIGCGVAIDGKLFTGSNGLLGEIYGNPIFSSNGNLTKIGKLCSGSKILKKLDKVATKEGNVEIIHEASIYLGTLLSSIIHLYNPDVIYFSGGRFSYKGFLDKAIEFSKKHTYKNFTSNLIFAESCYQSYAGCIGAIKLVAQEKK